MRSWEWFEHSRSCYCPAQNDGCFSWGNDFFANWNMWSFQAGVCPVAGTVGPVVVTSCIQAWRWHWQYSFFATNPPEHSQPISEEARPPKSWCNTLALVDRNKWGVCYFALASDQMPGIEENFCALLSTFEVCVPLHHLTVALGCWSLPASQPGARDSFV